MSHEGFSSERERQQFIDSLVSGLARISEEDRERVMKRSGIETVSSAASRGGKATARHRTKQERSEAARRAISARWSAKPLHQCSKCEFAVSSKKAMAAHVAAKHRKKPIKRPIPAKKA